MSLSILETYLRSFNLSFTQKSIQNIKKLLDPLHYKYKRPFNIINIQDNAKDFKQSKLTQKIVQLSIFKLFLDLQGRQDKVYMFQSFCYFFIQNKQQIKNLLQDNNDVIKILFSLLLRMLKNWFFQSQFSLQIKKNQKSFQLILNFIKDYLIRYINKRYIKRQTQKIFYDRQILRQSPASTSSIEQKRVQQSEIAQNKTRSAILSAQQTKAIKLQIQLQSPQQLIQIINRVYLCLISMRYLNDSSKASLRVSNKNNQLIFQQDQTIFFVYHNNLTLLVQTLKISFYLQTAGDIELVSQLFIICSSLLLFTKNSEKPVSFLRMILYQDNKLQKKQWKFAQIQKQQKASYYQLLKHQILKEVNFLPKIIRLIDQWILIGVDNSNIILHQHWIVLCQIVNKRTFNGKLQHEMINLLFNKSQTNKKNKIHVSLLLGQIIDNIHIQLLLKNHQQIFSLQEFLDRKKIKILQLYFQYCVQLMQKNKQISNTTIVNKIIELYLDWKQQTSISQGQFLQFFKQNVRKSVQNGQKSFLNQDNLKRIHVIQQVPLFITRKTSTNGYLQIQNAQIFQQSTQQVLQIKMLKQLLFQKKKGQSYFLKFSKELNPSYFQCDNIAVYETYSQYFIQKMSQKSITFQKKLNLKNISLEPNPLTFKKIQSLYHNFYLLVEENKIISIKLYKSMLLFQCLIQPQHLSDKFGWFIRKIKYFFGSNSQNFNSQIYISSNKSIGQKSTSSVSKFYIEMNQELTEQTQKLTNQLIDFSKSLFFKFKNKIAFLVYISILCLKCFQNCRVNHSNIDKLELNQHFISNQLKQINKILTNDQYCVSLSFSLHSTMALFILYFIQVSKDYYQKVNDRSNEQGFDFQKCDDSQILKEIRNILCLQIVHFHPFLLNEFLYMFTFKQSIGQSIVMYLNLPNFDYLPLISRLIPLLKITNQLTENQMKKPYTLNVLPFNNHVQFGFLKNNFKSEFSALKNDQKIYHFYFQLIANWQIQAYNFIGFSTKNCKYKLIISKQSLKLLSRKQGSQKTYCIDQHKITQPLTSSQILLQLLIHNNCLTVMIKKCLICTIQCQSSIQSIKLQLISQMIIKSISLSKSNPDIHFNSTPQIIQIQPKQSFQVMFQLDLQIRIKNFKYIQKNNQNIYQIFPYNKLFFIVKQLVHYNKELLQHQTFSYLLNIMQNIYLNVIKKYTKINGLKGDSQIIQVFKIFIRSMVENYIQSARNVEQSTKSLRLTRKYSHEIIYKTQKKLQRKLTINQPNNFFKKAHHDENILHRQLIIDKKVLNEPILSNLNNLNDIQYLICQGFQTYLQQTILKVQIWQFYSNCTKVDISKFLRNILKIKQFLNKIQNTDFSIFYQLVKILQYLTESSLAKIPSLGQISQQSQNKINFDQQSAFNISQCLKSLILQHQLNTLFKQKFKYYFYMAQTGKSPYLKSKFYQLIDLISKNLFNSLDQTKSISNISDFIGKWLILQFDKFQHIFINCRLQIKVQILDYLSQQNSKQQLIIFLRKIPIIAILQVKLWLMINIKKQIFNLNLKINVLTTMKYLGQMILVLLSCQQYIKQEQQRDQLLKILKTTFKYILQRQKQNQPISNQLLQIIKQDQFIRFFITLIDDCVLTRKRIDLSVEKFTHIVFEVIFNLEKKGLMKVFINYRRFSDKNVGLLMYPIKIQLSKSLKVSQLNSFLQYILQATLSIQNSLSKQEISYYVLALKGYMQYILKNYQLSSDLIYGLLYSYPKIYHSFNACEKNQLIKEIGQIGKKSLYELRGGIYFKIMIIVTHLIEMKQDQDFTFMIEQIIFKTYMLAQNPNQSRQKSTLATFRATTDFSQVQSQTKQRSIMQKLINTQAKVHKSYCIQNDYPLDPLQVAKTKTVKFQQENDLTPYFLDYFLMKVILFLQWMDDQNQDYEIDRIYSKYSNLIIKAFDKYPMIYNDITQTNISSKVCANDYSQLLLLITDQCQQNAKHQKKRSVKQILSPQGKFASPKQVIPQTDEQIVFSPSAGFYEEQNSSKKIVSNKNIKPWENQRFSKTAQKKQNRFMFNQISQKKDIQFLFPIEKVPTKNIFSQNTKYIKDKQILISELRQDHRVWRTKCLSKQFNKYFRDQAKQLLVIELMFTHFVQNTVLTQKQSTRHKKSSQSLALYFQKMQQQLQLFTSQQSSQLFTNKQLIRLFNIKRLSPYLIQKQHILKVKANNLPNMCMPILSKIPKKNYKLRQIQQVHSQSYIGQFKIDYFNQNINVTQNITEYNTSEDTYQPLDFQDQHASTPEKSVHSQQGNSHKQSSYYCVHQKQLNRDKQVNYCELITRKGAYFSEWKIYLKQQKRSIHFIKQVQKAAYILQIKSLSAKPNPCPRLLKYGSPSSNFIWKQISVKILISQIKQILYRKFNQIICNSLQVFTSDGRSFFLCLYSQPLANKLCSQLTKFSLSQSKIIKFLQKQFQRKGYTNKWINGQLDNFTYLMILNKYSGRSFCDTNQYPVFPWVIQNYKTNTLDLNDIHTYRDLTKPVGALNQKKLTKYYEKYYMQQEQNAAFLYGSHFSTSLFIYYFLVRMQPFSSLHQQMQGGVWDAPDRLFSSVQNMWESLMSPTSSTDIKEAIPEFYYFPFFLKNTNKIDLGVRQSNQPVNNVILPEWAKTSEQFIFKMRKALQSNYVSLHLPQWIDLIFGIDQKNIKRHSLYHPLSYSQNINIDKIPQNQLQAIVCQINFFGQHPIKILDKPHKEKKIAVTNLFSLGLLPGGLNRIAAGTKKMPDFSVVLLPNTCEIVDMTHNKENEGPLLCNFKIKYYLLNIQLQMVCDLKFQSLQNILKKILNSGKDLQKNSSRRRSVTFQNQRNEQRSTQKPASSISTTPSGLNPYYSGFQQESTCNIYSIINPLTSTLTWHSTNPSHILTTITFSQSYSKHLYNQSFVILYGQMGLTIYNWNFQVVWKFPYFKQIDKCFLLHDLLYMATKDGRIYTYEVAYNQLTIIADLNDMEERYHKNTLKQHQNTQKQLKKTQKQHKNQIQHKYTQKQHKNQKQHKKGQKQMIKIQKQHKNSPVKNVQKIYHVQMLIFTQKKLISNTNQEQCKILLVANKKKIFLLNHKLTKKNWARLGQTQQNKR